MIVLMPALFQSYSMYSFDWSPADILEMCDRSKRKELAEKEKDLFEKERGEKKMKKSKKIVKKEEDEDEVRFWAIENRYPDLP